MGDWVGCGGGYVIRDGCKLVVVGFVVDCRLGRRMCGYMWQRELLMNWGLDGCF